ncbi:MAG: hypothetical protein WA850_09145, partial [Xanthobacteraceae bacterium]
MAQLVAVDSLGVLLTVATIRLANSVTAHGQKQKSPSPYFLSGPPGWLWHSDGRVKRADMTAARDPPSRCPGRRNSAILGWLNQLKKAAFAARPAIHEANKIR